MELYTTNGKNIMLNNDDIFEIDEIENLLDNLEFITIFNEMKRPYKWKWIIIALHQALYSALITVLQGTDPRQTVLNHEGDQGKALALHVNKVPIDVIALSFGVSEEKVVKWITEPHLISFGDALRRVKDPKYLPYNDSIPLRTTKEDDEAIEKISRKYRNNFVHFKPQGWIILTAELPSLILKINKIISFLELESNCVILSDDQEIRMKNMISKINNQFSRF